MYVAELEGWLLMGLYEAGEALSNCCSLCTFTRREINWTLTGVLCREAEGFS